MRKLYSFVLLIVFQVNIYAQQFDWARVEGLWAYDYGYGIVSDVSGNVYLAGKYEQQANFSGLLLNNRGNHDFFLAKYSDSGNLQWITSGGGALGDYATCLATDANNYLYIGGEIEGYGIPVTFDNSSEVLYVTGDNDVFLAKYDLNGQMKWVKSAGGYKSDKAHGIHCDQYGNVLVCGLFTDTIVFDSTHILYGNGQKDLFVAKYDSLGSLLWAKGAGSAGRDEAKSISSDALGNIYVTGLFSNVVDFGGVTLSSPNGYYDMFLAKYDPQGNLLWVRQGSSSFDEVGWGVTLDNSGKIYVTGEFNAYAVFDSQAVVTSGMSDFFVASYDSNGQIQWVKSGGGSLIERARGITSDGNVMYVTGQFGGQAQIESVTLTASDSSDIFISAIDDSGTFLWSISVGGGQDSLEELSYESGNAICADANSGAVYATGSLLNGGIFGLDTLSGYTRSDAFICKIIHPALFTNDSLLKYQLKLLPNPTTERISIQTSDHFSKQVQVTILSMMGTMVFSSTCVFNNGRAEIDVSDLSPGIYFIQLENQQFNFKNLFSISH